MEQATLFAGMKAEESEGELKRSTSMCFYLFLRRILSCIKASLPGRPDIVLDGELVARMTEGDNEHTVDYLRTGTLLTPAFLFFKR